MGKNFPRGRFFAGAMLVFGGFLAFAAVFGVFDMRGIANLAA